MATSVQISIWIIGGILMAILIFKLIKTLRQEKKEKEEESKIQ